MSQTGDRFPGGQDPVAQKARAGFLFQKGIAKYMTGQDLAGKKNLFKAMEILTSFSSAYQSSEDWLRLFFIRWLIYETEDIVLLEKARKAVENRLAGLVLTLGDHSLYISFLKGGLAMSAAQETECRTFCGTADKYGLESFGDLLLACGRITLMEANFQQTILLAEQAQNFYRKALELIPAMVEGEFPHLGGHANSTDAALMAENSPAAKEIIEKRNQYRGNIPECRIQCELLSEISGFLIKSDYNKFKLIRQKFDQFINQTVSPRVRETSVLGFLEELQWVYIRKRYAYSLYNQALERTNLLAVRKLLGGI